MKASFLNSPKSFLLIMPLILGVAGCNTPNATATKAAAKVSGELSDGEILQVVHAINGGEIQHAHLALEKSSRAEVKNTAQMIIRDHTSLDDQVIGAGIALKDTTLSKGVQVQAEQVRKELAELSGQEFDCKFLEKQIKLHQVALDTVRKELKPDAQDEKVRQVVAKAEPSLERHLKEAQKHKDAMGGCAG